MREGNGRREKRGGKGKLNTHKSFQQSALDAYGECQAEQCECLKQITLESWFHLRFASQLCVLPEHFRDSPVSTKAL